MTPVGQDIAALVENGKIEDELTGTRQGRSGQEIGQVWDRVVVSATPMAGNRVMRNSTDDTWKERLADRHGILRAAKDRGN